MNYHDLIYFDMICLDDHLANPIVHCGTLRLRCELCTKCLKSGSGRWQRTGKKGTQKSQWLTRLRHVETHCNPHPPAKLLCWDGLGGMHIYIYLHHGENTSVSCFPSGSNMSRATRYAQRMIHLCHSTIHPVAVWRIPSIVLHPVRKDYADEKHSGTRTLHTAVGKDG